MKHGLGRWFIGRPPPKSLAPHSKFIMRLVTGFWKRSISGHCRSSSSSAGAEPSWRFPIKVFYKSALVGEYYADLLVDGSVMVEIKVAKCYNPEDEAQLLNELKATAVKVGMLVNFGREHVQYKRMIL